MNLKINNLVTLTRIEARNLIQSYLICDSLAVGVHTLSRYCWVNKNIFRALWRARK